MPKTPWAHPTKQRLPDEAHARLGNRSKIIHVRVSEPEYEALMLAMASSGTRKLSRFLRALILRECAAFLTPAAPQALPFSGPPASTVPAQSGDDALEEWLRLHNGALKESDLFEPLLDASEPLVQLVDTLPPAPAPVREWPREPAQAPEAPRRPFAAPQAHVQPATPADPGAWWLRPPTAEEVAAVRNGPVSLEQLRELREIMGDDSMVDPAVRAALALHEDGG